MKSYKKKQNDEAVDLTETVQQSTTSKETTLTGQVSDKTLLGG